MWRRAKGLNERWEHSERLQCPIPGAFCHHPHADFLLSGIMEQTPSRARADLRCGQKSWRTESLKGESMRRSSGR